MNETNQNPAFSTVSGRWVVLGMVAFGVIMTGAIWVYSKIELEPFQPLARAIKAEFPKSRPHVKGGRPKNKPPLLRIVMQVDFAPSETDVRVKQIVDRVIALAKLHVDLAAYEKIEIHIVHYVPENNPERITIERQVSKLLPGEVGSSELPPADLQPVDH
jgi:hypothetical protein